MFNLAHYISRLEKLETIEHVYIAFYGRDEDGDEVYKHFTTNWDEKHLASEFVSAFVGNKPLNDMLGVEFLGAIQSILVFAKIQRIHLVITGYVGNEVRKEAKATTCTKDDITALFRLFLRMCFNQFDGNKSIPKAISESVRQGTMLSLKEK